MKNNSKFSDGDAGAEGRGKYQALPKGWQCVKLGDIAAITTGGKNNQDKKKNGEYPFFVRSKNIERINTFSHNGEAILIPGEGDIENIIHYVNGKFDYHQRVYCISNFSKYIFGKFLFYYLKEHFPRQARKFTVRATADSLRQEAFFRMVVCYPKLLVQKKIASLLETWDAAIEKTERLIAAKEKHFKYLLKTLISDQQNNPEWGKMKLKNIAQMGSGGTPKSTIFEYYGGDVSWVSITDMTTQGMWIKKTARSITTLGLKNSSARIYPKNSVLYAMYASLGECSILDINASSSQAILGITPFPNKLHYEYLYYYLSSIKERVKLQGQWGTQSNLNIEIVKNFHIPIPTLPLQKNITLILNTIQHETGILKNLAEKYRTQKRGLMQKLLKGA